MVELFSSAFMWNHVFLFIFILSMSLLSQFSSAALKCIQCNTVEKSYLRGGNQHGGEIDMTECYEGRIEPRLCPNPNHTHCVTYYFKNVQSQKIMVLWRKCGYSKDTLHPCQVHDIGADAVVDLYGGAPGSYKQIRFRPINESLERILVADNKRRSLVQVCVAGCGQDGCLADGSQSKNLIGLPTILLCCFLWHLAHWQLLQ